jgi:hypothetical protein
LANLGSSSWTTNPRVSVEKGAENPTLLANEKMVMHKINKVESVLFMSTKMRHLVVAN